MSEHHQIAGPARGEPMDADRVGACVRIPLDSAPTPCWSQALSTHLVAKLTGHAAVGHMRLNRVVQGAEIVLEGVESAEAEPLGAVLCEAIAAANGACRDTDAVAQEPRNMAQAEADDLARTLEATALR